MKTQDSKVGRGVPAAPSEVKRTFGECRTAKEPLLSPAEAKGVSGILPPEFSRRIVAHYCVNEWAIHLDDIMLRRTRWHYYFPNAAEMAERVADCMRELLGWSEATRRTELERYLQAVSFNEHSPKRVTADIESERRVHDEVPR
jgi:glycerol-3-phosphate dehydrogenase